MHTERLGSLASVLLIMVTAASALQSERVAITPDFHVIRQQLAGMIQQAIKRSTFSLPDGTTATTVPLLSSEDYETAKRFGDGATSVLAEYLGSKRFFEQLLAIRLLAQIGTEASKDVLDDFAEKPELIATRSYALDFVASSGRQKDFALVQKIADADPNPHLRTRAVEVLQQYKKEDSR